MTSQLLKLIKSDTQFQNIVSDIVNHEIVLSMKNINHHYNTSCFEHSYAVSYISYLIAKKLNLDFKSIARAGLLHDLFLYDWKKPQPEYKGLHAFNHPQIACDNANKYFKLSKKEQNIIKEHMWPVTTKLPSSFESLIVTFVDKYSALQEFSEALNLSIFKNTSLKNIYIFLSTYQSTIYSL